MRERLCRGAAGVAAALLIVNGAEAPAASRQAIAPAASHVVGMGNFSHIVADLDRAIAFYRDGLGLELAAPARPFEAMPAVQKAGNVPGAEVRYVAEGAWIGDERGSSSIGHRSQAGGAAFQNRGAQLTIGVRDIDGAP